MGVDQSCRRHFCHVRWIFFILSGTRNARRLQPWVHFARLMGQVVGEAAVASL